MAGAVVCAAKTYLDQHGVPLTLEDLHDHNCIIYTYTARPNV